MNEGPELFPSSAGGRDGKHPGKIGGCVGTFLQLFDWNPRKRLFATKRLPAERPGAKKVAAASPTAKKYKDERMPVAKLLLLAEEENRGGFPSPKKCSSVSSADRLSEDGAGARRVPGVVARLMGLESLPDEPVNDGRVSPKMPMDVRPLQELLHSRPEPVLLSDLLREREYLETQKLSLQDRLHDPAPGHAKKLPESGGQPRSHISPRSGYRKSFRQEPHLQPYSDQKYNRNVRPLRRAPPARDFSDPKQLIMALSPRGGGDGLRPVLLPSKAHNKLMNSPVKSPTKMGSRSARLLEAAVKILEPSMQQPAGNRPRATSARPSSFREFKDMERDVAMEERRENAVMSERRTSNAARALKGQNMSRSWNGREEGGRYSGGPLHYGAASERRRRHEHGHGSQTRVASPVRVPHRGRGGSRSMVAPESASSGTRDLEDVKTVVPEGFEEAYGGGLKPLNVGRREDSRLDKYEAEDRRVSEKHIVSSLSSLSSLSLGNSPFSECSDKSTVPAFHDSLRRSGSAKEGPPVPPTPIASKSRFIRSKSVKEEKSLKQNSKSSVVDDLPHRGRGPAKAARAEQEFIPVMREASQQSHEEVDDEVAHEAALETGSDRVSLHEIDGHCDHDVHEVIHLEDPESFLEDGFEVGDHDVDEEGFEGFHDNKREVQENGYQDLRLFDGGLERIAGDAVQEQALDSPLSIVRETDAAPESPQLEAAENEAGGGAESEEAADERKESGHRDGESILAELLSPRVPRLDHELSADESPLASPQTSSPSQESPSKDASRSGGGLLSYSRLFGGRKSGERKGESKGKSKVKGEASARKSESSLVKALLRRKSATHQSSTSGAAAEKLKKRSSKKFVESEVPSRDGDGKSGPYFDMAAVIRANKCEDSEDEVRERVIHAEGGAKRELPSKTVDDVFPVLPPALDKGCLRMLDDVDGAGSGRRLAIEGFDEVEDDGQDLREGILTYAAQLVDDLKLDEVFSAGGADIQSAGRNGFSYSPLVELAEPARLSLESYILEGGGGMAEVEKCVSFLGRTSGDVSSPETSFSHTEQAAEPAEGLEDSPIVDEKAALQTRDSEETEHAGSAAIDDPKEKLLTELSEARKIVDNAIEEATERVAKKMSASKGRVGLAGVDGGEEAVCASAGGTDDCGQPSPVSVLDCTFEEDESRSSQGNVHESICEAEASDFGGEDEDSLIDDLLYECATAVDSTAKARKERRKISSLNAAAGDGGGKTRTEKIVGAILDMSRVRCASEPSSCELVVTCESRQEEEEYVRKILSVWEASGEAAAANSALPINPTLFDRVESQGRALAWKMEKDREAEAESFSPEGETPPSPAVSNLKQWQGLWLHRRMLFDCINETLGHSLRFKFPEPWTGAPALRPRPTGAALVKQVYGEMAGWREIGQTEELDTIIEMDMYRGCGNWSNLNQEVGEIGLEIERTLLRVLIEELVAEIMGVTSNRASMAAVDDCESMAGDDLELVSCC